MLTWTRRCFLTQCGHLFWVEEALIILSISTFYFFVLRQMIVDCNCAFLGITAQYIFFIFYFFIFALRYAVDEWSSIMPKWSFLLPWIYSANFSRVHFSFGGNAVNQNYQAHGTGKDTLQETDIFQNQYRQCCSNTPFIRFVPLRTKNNPDIRSWIREISSCMYNPAALLYTIVQMEAVITPTFWERVEIQHFAAKRLFFVSLPALVGRLIRLMTHPGMTKYHCY